MERFIDGDLSEEEQDYITNSHANNSEFLGYWNVAVDLVSQCSTLDKKCRIEVSLKKLIKDINNSDRSNHEV